ncbi:MAG TPA: peptidoglycan DD-metalloendopeptidase family protein [Deltaproteobacteria bacterium]|nr:peptidoglycan DD-metalloendopeptidase family protein [Deltaproteobacteria bacterium]
MGRLLKAALAAAAVIALISPCAPAADPKTDIKELGRKVKAIEKQKETEHRRLAQIDRRIELTRRDMLEAEKKSKELKARMEEQKARIAASESTLREARRMLRRKWAAFYKGAYLDMVDILAAHPEYSGYVDAVIAHDLDRIEAYQKTKEDLQGQRDALDRITLQHEAALRDLDRAIRDLNERHDEKTRLIASLDAQKRDCENRIKALMKKLRERPTALPDRGMNKRIGELPWPVKGSLVRGFGISRDMGYAQISNGVDIEAQEGTPVKTIYSGRIAFYDTLPKFGNTMIIDHGGGLFTVYGHLMKALKAAGEEVKAQEEVALVGASGDVSRPTLHFEIRYKDKPQDPVRWLSSKR